MARAPKSQDGDGPRETYSLGQAGAGYEADVPLPALKPGQVCWVRPLLVSRSGTTRWGGATPLPPETLIVLERGRPWSASCRRRAPCNAACA